MAKKPKAPAALDWRTGKGYPEHGERTNLWAWEFLRRNPDYRAAWRRFLAVADELQGSYRKPYDDLPDNWEASPCRPYWIIAKARDEGDMRARVFDPPAQDGESEDEYLARIFASGRGCTSQPLERAMGSTWGLNSIADPGESRLNFNHKWELAPYGVSSPGEHRDNRESLWVYYLEHLAKLLRADPLPADSLQAARALLEEIPAAWEKRLAQMDEFRRERQGRFVVEFDLRVSIPEQMKHAAAWAEGKQATWRKGGGVVWSDGRKNKETPGYATYLRALDAIEEIGEANDSQWKKEVASAMMPGYPITATYDERKAYLQKASVWVTRAKQLRDGEYLRLVAMATRPTIAEFERARKRKK